MQKRYVRKDGSSVWVDLHCSLVRDAAGAPRYFLSQVQDISERRLSDARLRQAAAELRVSNEMLATAVEDAMVGENRYLALVDQLPDTAVYVFDADNRITSATGSSLSTRGVEVDSLLGRRLADIAGADDARVIEGYLRAAHCGLPVTAEQRSQLTGRDLLLDIVPVDQPGHPEVLVVARDISDSRNRERELAHAEARWRAAFHDAPVAMAEVSGQGRIIVGNPSLVRLTGRPLADLVDLPWTELLHSEDRSLGERAGYDPGPDHPGSAPELRVLRPDGATVWVTVRSSILNIDGEAEGPLLLHLMDITSERDRRQAIEDASARFSALVEHSSDLIAVASADMRLLYASPAYRTVMGVAAAEDLGAPIAARLHPDDVETAIAALKAAAADSGNVVTFEARVCPVGGPGRTLEITASNRLDDPAIGGIVCNCRDVSERVEAVERLAHQAMHDSLTGLANRALILDRLGHALARADRSDRACALLFLDLDKFKLVNDNMGHSAGDELLITVADRLKSVIRPGDTLGRLGGDEFIILAEDLAEVSSAMFIAERIQRALLPSIVLQGRDVTVACSIGIAMSDGQRPEALLQEADIALYRAKERGRNRCELYEPGMRTLTRRRMDTEGLLRRALDRDELRVVYQPIVDLTTGQVTGTEALARLQSPDESLLNPGEFIDVAEDSGLIVALGAAVLDRACAQHAQWQAGPLALQRVSVNLSPRQLADPGLVEQVTQALQGHRLSPEQLCLELTESAIIDAGPGIKRSIEDLKELGVALALDDFGTGWSSLAYLRRFPVDIIKIDRSFVSGLGINDDDTELIRAVIGLAKALGLTTTAEGIETLAQARQLCELGCDFGQGFLYGRPALAADLALMQTDG
jgi:diguanylate cyclase (GGDEF)-like protein/PAS domain S-box-containing protein